MSTYNAADWDREWRLAEERNDLDAAAFILAQKILLSSKQLGLGFFERAGFKAFTRSLNNPDSYIMDAVGNPLTISQVYGKMFKGLVRNYLWMLGPFAFRWFSNLEERLEFTYLSKRLRTAWIENDSVKPEFFQRVGLPASPFGNRVFEAIFLDINPEKRMRIEQKGWFRNPACLFFISLGLSSLMNIPLNPEAFLSRVSSPGPTYSSTDFVKDFQKATGRSLKDAEVTYIADANLLSDALQLDDSPTGKLSKDVLEKTGNLDPGKIPFIHDVQQASKVFHLVVVDSVASFNSAIKAAKNSDFVFLNFHGAPGIMNVGGTILGTNFEESSDNLDVVEANRLKSGAILIFFSCHFGEKQNKLQPDEGESWIKISRKLQDSGIAVSAVNNLGFRAFDIIPTRLTGSHSLNWGQLSAAVGSIYLMAGERIITKSVLGPWSYRAMVFHAVDARPKVLEESRPSFRVFHPDNGEVEHLHLR